MAYQPKIATQIQADVGLEASPSVKVVFHGLPPRSSSSRTISTEPPLPKLYADKFGTTVAATATTTATATVITPGTLNIASSEQFPSLRSNSVVVPGIKPSAPVSFAQKVREASERIQKAEEALAEEERRLKESEQRDYQDAAIFQRLKRETAHTREEKDEDSEEEDMDRRGYDPSRYG